ncbi:unnamed protein product, partial [Mesorhabditis spiculigera]
MSLSAATAMMGRCVVFWKTGSLALSGEEPNFFNAPIYRDALCVYQESTTVCHSEPLEELCPILQDERLRPHQPHHIRLLFGGLCILPAVSPANPEYCAVFEQIAHIPRISVGLGYRFNSCWVPALEVATLVLEAALVTYRPIGRKVRITTIGIENWLEHDQQPAEYRLTDALRDLLENSVSAEDQVAFYRRTKLLTGLLRPPGKAIIDKVEIVLAQNCEHGNVELRREKKSLDRYECLEKWPKEEETGISP